jgi:Na+/proline symporter
MRVVPGLLLVALATAVAVGGLVLVQRLVSTERRKQHNDVAGFIYAVLGVSYAVLLGLMLIAVWEQWNAAQDVASDEANELAGIFWFAHALPQPEGRHVQELARSYAEVVVNKEWPAMEQGRSSPKAWATLDELRGTILGLNPPTGAQQVRYNQVLEQLHGLGDARRERLLAASEGVPTILWVVLIGGGVITIAFTYLFGLDNTTVHTLMVASLALIIALSLFTVAALNHPFKGDVRIHPAAFEQVLERFHESKLSDL